MKILDLTAHLLKSYFSKSKTVFGVFLFSCVLLSFGIFVLYDTSVSFVAQEGSTGYGATYYWFGMKKQMSFEEITDYMDECSLIKDCFLEADYLSGSAEDGYFTIHTFRPPTAKIQPKWSNPAIEGRLFFTEEEILAKEPVAIVSAGFPCRVGDRIDVGLSEEVKVVGIIQSMAEMVYIPDYLFDANGLPVRSAEFFTSQRLNLFEMIELDRFAKSHEELAYFDGFHTFESEMEQIRKDFRDLLIVLVILFVFFLYIMQYITEKNRRTYEMFRLLGAGRRATLLIFLSERLFLMITASTVAALLHYFLSGKLYAFLQFGESHMKPTDYLVAVFLIGIAAAVVSIPYSFAFMKTRKGAVK